jgi:hypothetical protein
VTSIYLLISLLTALTLSACIIPIPILPGQNPFEERVDFIRVCQTSRAEVIAKLSAPPIVRRDERFFGYIAYERGYGVVVIIGGPRGSWSFGRRNRINCPLCRY